MTQSEAATRSELIDKQLILSGWNVKDPTQVVEEYDILTALPEGVAEPRTLYEGRQFSDYVLLGKNGKPLAVVEAKKSSKDAAIGREQAKQYCHNIRNQLRGELPFCFYTNGLVTSVKLQPKGKELKPQLPLPVRLVGLRLDKIEKAIASGHQDIAEREINKLRNQVAELPQSSVVVKEAATARNKLKEENFWITLNHPRLEFLRAEIKPLFRTVSEADFKAMRFERDLLEYSLAKLNEEKERADTVHNDYSNGACPKFEFFSDRLEITSAGGLPYGVTNEDFFNGYSSHRNKVIMRVFRDLEIVEQLGSGVPRILEKYGRDAFEIRPNFLRVIFRYEKPFNEQIVESGVESEMALQIMKLLMSASLSKTEIASALGKPKPTRYLNDLVKKLLEAGQVAYGIPDKPNSRFQKYRLTDKGRALLIKLDQGK